MKNLRRGALVLIAAILIFIVLTHIRESRHRSSTRTFAIYRVVVDGKCIPIVDIKPCQSNSTLDGMRTTLREVSRSLRLPESPKLMLAQPGLGATIYSERRHFARTGQLTGKDLVICADMSDRFKWPWESADLRMVRIDEKTSRRLERLVVAIRQEWRRTPDAILESQATRLIVPGTYGSVTLADLMTKGKLAADFRLNRVVCVAVPLRGGKIDKTLRSRMGDVLCFTTPSPTGFVSGEPLVGEPHVEIRLRDGNRVRHKYLFAETLPDGSVNPTPDLTAMFLNGSTTAAVQTRADGCIGKHFTRKSGKAGKQEREGAARKT